MAENETQAHSGEAITIMRIRPRDQHGIVLTSTAIGTDEDIADRYSAYHDNLSPPPFGRPCRARGPMRWWWKTRTPRARRPSCTGSPGTFPGEATALPEGIANAAHPVSPQGFDQGKNDNGSYGWFGPRPPRGHGVHHYHFQLFALDAPLKMDATTRSWRRSSTR